MNDKQKEAYELVYAHPDFAERAREASALIKGFKLVEEDWNRRLAYHVLSGEATAVKAVLDNLQDLTDFQKEAAKNPAVRKFLSDGLLYKITGEIPGKGGE